MRIQLFRGERGQAIVEYILILALVSLLGVTSLRGIGEGVVKQGNKVADLLESGGSGGDTGLGYDDDGDEVELPEPEPEPELDVVDLVEVKDFKYTRFVTGGAHLEYIGGSNVDTIVIPLSVYVDKEDGGRLYALEDRGHVDGVLYRVRDDKIVDELEPVVSLDNSFNGNSVEGGKLKGDVKIVLGSGNKVRHSTNLFRHNPNLKSIDLTDFNTENFNTLEYAFAGNTSLEKVEFGVGFDTSNVVDMRHMFYDCSSLVDLDLSKFDTSKVKHMGWMFRGCKNLEGVDLSSFNTENVVYFDNMFRNCSSLKELDLSSFDTRKAKELGWMFSGCSSLTELDVRHFDTSNVVGMSNMFAGCSSLREIDISTFRTGRVDDLSGLFSGCSSLVDLNMGSNFETGEVKQMDSMFRGCINLKDLDISSFNTRKVESMSRMFKDCKVSGDFKTGPNFKPLSGKSGEELVTGASDNIINALGYN